MSDTTPETDGYAHLEDARDDPECYDEDAEPYCDRCDNTGVLNCFCGGDFCCCENNGEMLCPECDRGF